MELQVVELSFQIDTPCNQRYTEVLQTKDMAR